MHEGASCKLILLILLQMGSYGYESVSVIVQTMLWHIRNNVVHIGTIHCGS